LNRILSFNHFDFHYFDFYLLLVIRIFNRFALDGFALKNLRGRASFSSAR